ncbi:MAG: ATP-binding protein [candidate division Zixibacteria bacterium]|nr:ATP-binding protein [candidate division Zixibacteria bacterium]
MEYKGRIIGKSITEIYFRTFYEEELHLGDILVAQDEERNLPFYLRVVEVSYGVEATDPDWASRTAGNMMLLDQQNESYQFQEKERRLFKIGKCVPLGYVKNNQFRKPKTIPEHFSKVRTPNNEDFLFLKKYMGDIEIGQLRSGEDVIDFKIGISGELFPYHIGLFATTGMGKSNLMKVLASSVLESGKYGMLILDPHGEYYNGGGDPKHKGLVDHPLAKEWLRVYSSRDLKGPYNQLKISSKEIEIKDVRQIYGFTQAQVEALYALAHHFGRDWLDGLKRSSISELAMSLSSGGAFFESTIGVIQRRAEQILRLPFVHGDPNVSITVNVINDLSSGKVVLIDTSNMSEQEELLISAVLARAVFSKNKEAYQDPVKFKKILPTLIVMEEAQRVLSQRGEADINIFAQISREGRKFKTGLCAITQQPKLIDEELLSQFNTLFILGLADERDRNILKSSAKQDISDLGTEIQMLEAGEALITSPQAPFAIPAKVYLFEEWLSQRKEKFKGKNSIDVKVDEGFFK